MDNDEFRKHGRNVIESIVKYFEEVELHDVQPSVEPGYLKSLLPDEAPVEGEQFEAILDDVNRLVVPGITHWQSPHFHAYYPSLTSYPSILGDLLSSSFSCIGFSWVTSPVSTELETIVLDWLGKLLKLPDDFLADSVIDGLPCKGGGVIQGTASESLLVTLVAAREEALNRLSKKELSITSRHRLLEKMVAYCSDQTHSSFAKGCRVAMINSRILPTGSDNNIDADVLQQAIDEDRAKGLVPFYLCSTLGTTSTCAFDDLTAVGPVCKRNALWLHVDAAYAGPSFICDEYRPLLDGIEHCDSFNMNCHKWMLISFDCSPLWVRDRNTLIRALNTQFVMFDETFSGLVTDYKDWQIPLGRRFRALKVWFVLRSYGASGLRSMIRKHCQHTKYFRQLVVGDDRFEVLSCTLGLCCFKLKGNNDINENLMSEINKDKTIYITPTVVKGQRIIRFVSCAERQEEKHVDYAWHVIRTAADRVLLRTDVLAVS